MKRALFVLPLVVACGSSPPPKVEGAPAASPPPPPASATVEAPKEPAKDPKKDTSTMTTFADDLAFMEKHGKRLTLTGEGDAKVALSAEWQGRVMTSAVSAQGRSLGWINRSFIEAKKTGTQF